MKIRKSCIWVCVSLLTTPVWGQNPLTQGIVHSLEQKPVFDSWVWKPGFPSPAQLLKRSYAFQQQHDGALPKQSFYYRGKVIPTNDMKEEQFFEAQLARQVYHTLKHKPAPQDPAWQELARLYTPKREISEPLPDPAEFLEQLTAWVEKHNGLRPRRNIYENGVHMSVEQLKQHPGLYEERMLARRLNYFLQIGVQDETVLQGLKDIQQRPTITHLEAFRDEQLLDESGQVLPEWREKQVEELENWSQAHHNTKPRLSIYVQQQRVPVAQMTPEEYEEYHLARRMVNYLKKADIDESLRERVLYIKTLPTWNPDMLQQAF